MTLLEPKVSLLPVATESLVSYLLQEGKSVIAVWSTMESLDRALLSLFPEIYMYREMRAAKFSIVYFLLKRSWSWWDSAPVICKTYLKNRESQFKVKQMGAWVQQFIWSFRTWGIAWSFLHCKRSWAKLFSGIVLQASVFSVVVQQFLLAKFPGNIRILAVNFLWGKLHKWL